MSGAVAGTILAAMFYSIASETIPKWQRYLASISAGIVGGLLIDFWPL